MNTKNTNSSITKKDIQLFAILNLFATIICLLALLSNFITSPSPIVLATLSIISLLFLLFYYLAYFRGFYRSLILPFYLTVLASLILNWFYSQGVEGATSFYMLSFALVMIYGNTSRKYWQVFGLFFVIALLLIALQYLYPESFRSYPSLEDKKLDLSLNFIITLGLVGAATVYYKKEFDKVKRATDDRKRELEESEARFRDVALMSGEWIWETDVAGKYIYSSEKVEGILGYSPIELIDKKFYDLFVDVEEESSKMVINSTLINRASYMKIELWLKPKSGEKVCIRSSGIPIFDDFNKFKGFRGLNYDITLQKEQEEANYLKQYYLDTLMDNIPDAIYFKDKKSRFLRINKALAKSFGIEDPEDAKGKLDADFFGDEHAEETFRDEQEIIRTGIPIVAKEEREIWSGKPSSWVSTTKMPLFDEKNKIIGTFGISRDITESKQMSEVIKKRILALTRPLSKDNPLDFDELFDLENIQRIQDQFSQITGVASLITHPDGTPITKPSNFTRFCGEKVRMAPMGCMNCQLSDAALGKPYTNGPTIGYCSSSGLRVAGASILMGEHHVANWLMGQVRDENASEDTIRKYAHEIGVDEVDLLEAFREIPTMSLDRFTEIANTLYTLAQNLSNSAYQNLQQARFIYERQQAEEALRQNETELMELNATKDRFFSIIAHDLKSPFNSIFGFSELLEAELNEKNFEKATEYCGIVKKSAQNTMDLLNNLLDWARTQSHKMVYNPLYVDLNLLIHEVVDLMLHTASQKSIRLLMDIPAKVHVYGDKQMISTILRNLISNAIKFTNPAGSVSIFVTEFSHKWKISVRDDGVGIDSTELSKLFRIDESLSTRGTQGERGTGLGLILCKEFVQKMGGDIGVESEPRMGSTFYFTIPKQAENENQA